MTKPSTSSAFSSIALKQPDPPKIYLYADQGTAFNYVELFLKNRFPHARIERITGADLRQNDWSNQNGMMVIPGIYGEKCPYYDQIGEEGRESIKAFLRQPSNILLTFCAGTYILFSDITYHHSNGTTINRRSNLALIDGCIEGPPKNLRFDPARDGFMMARIHYEDSKGIRRQATIAHENGPALNNDVLMANGAAFLGTYADTEGAPASGFVMPYENGTIIGFATLPYLGSQSVINPHGPYAFKLQEMQQYEAGRQRYCNNWLRLIGVVSPGLKPAFYEKKQLDFTASSDLEPPPLAYQIVSQ